MVLEAFRTVTFWSPIAYTLDGLQSCWFLPFTASVFEDLGFNATLSGLTLAFAQMAAVFTQTGACWIADYFAWHHQMYLLCRWVSVPPVVALWIALSTKCRSFTVYFLLVGLCRSFWAPTAPLIDNSIIHLLTLKGIKHDYGKVRLFTSFGRMGGSAIAGLIYQHFGSSTLCVVWTFTCLLNLLCGIPQPIVASTNSRRRESVVHEDDTANYGTVNGPVHPQTENACVCETDAKTGKVEVITHTQHKSSTASEPLLQSDSTQHQQIQWRSPSENTTGFHYWVSLLCSVQFLLWMLVITINGMSGAMFDYYVVLFIKDLHGSGFLQGMVVVVASGSAMPGFFLFPTVAKYISDYPIVIISILIGILRCWLYSTLTTSTRWWVIGIQCLHGVQFCLWWMSGLAISKALFPEKYSATALSIFGAVYFGLGASAGTVLAGWLYDTIGARDTFLVLAGELGACLVVFLLFCLAQWLAKRK
eukprot:TRINITY_DN20783_c0_g1_i1.p1 TRINITY_DN20783_c0_g1~~TRINITY_DN20783_c0_g1_i1.p1  ORF type:complete len:475 (-),score=15.76 TRINITY_DN20783_c0_g1_i1:99-1523(-)